MKRTLCVFGGSFDPPTSAHMNIIKELSKKFDKVLVVVNLCNYYRDDVFMLTFEARKKIVDDACKHFKLNNVIVSDIEKNLNIDHTFIDAIKAVYNKFSNRYEIYSAIGGDSYKNFKTWFAWKSILNYTKLVVIPRVSMNKYVSDPEIPHTLLDVDISDSRSATVLRSSIYEKILNNLGVD